MLRYILKVFYIKLSISCSPDVCFCGYTIPHPQENKMHFRIQAQPNVRAVDILRRGLKDLEDVCDHTITTFDEAMGKYRRNHE